MIRLCSIEGCGRVHVGKGYCGTHYSRLVRGSDLHAPIVSRAAHHQPCQAEGCEREAKARGFCKLHYERVARCGDPQPDQAAAPHRVLDPCTVGGCNTKHYALGLCRLHWRRFTATGQVNLVPKRESGICAVPICSRVVRARGYCNTHLARLQRLGDVQADRPIKRYHGGTCHLAHCERRHYCLGYCQAHYVQRVHGPKRRALEQSAHGSVTAEQLEARVAYFGWRCWMCGAPWTCIDHVKPLAAGGSNWPANLRPACRSCNASKWARWSGVAQLSEVFQRAAA